MTPTPHELAAPKVPLPPTTFIGLGAMGAAMAGNLARAGCPLTVFNRTPERAGALVAAGAATAATMTDAVRLADVVITMLADDKATEEAVFGGKPAPRTGSATSVPATGGASGTGAGTGGVTPTGWGDVASGAPRATTGLLGSMRPGAVHVCMATISPALSERLAEAHAQAGQAYLAAPVFGRPDAAASAALVVVAGGPADVLNRVRPLLDAMARKVFHLDPAPGPANTLKLSGNFMILNIANSLAEIFAWLRKSGVDPAMFLEIVNGELLRSPVVANYGRMVADGPWDQPGFTARLALKDARLILAAADAVEAPMPSAAVLHAHLLEAVARGKGDMDATVLGQMLGEAAGL